MLLAYHRPPLDRPRELRAYVEVVLERMSPPPRMPPRVLREPIFHPAMVRARWPVPRIDTVGDLAAWLELEVGELEWFADVRGLERRGRRRAPAPLPLRARCRARPARRG